MQQFTPTTAEELADVLRSAAANTQTIQITGNNSKRLMGGPVMPAHAVVSTCRLGRVLRYERDDLTVSVETGMPFAQLQVLLANNNQMLAIDPPFAASATVGGVLGTNSSGPMRRGFGTARDLLIGMTFATLDGKLIKTGGMVVKNVAGLDLGKLMIGSFGTLAVIASANFRVHSMPPETRTFLFSYKDVDSAVETRDRIVRSCFQPMALDVITPPAAARLGTEGYLLAVRAGGSARVLKRYTCEFPEARKLTGRDDADFWQRVQEFSTDFLKRQPSGIIVRISTTLSEVRSVLKLLSSGCISRAGSGVTYVYLTTWQGVLPLWQAGRQRGWNVVVEFAPDEIRASKELWLQSSDAAHANAFGMMVKVKRMLDPDQLLNRSRLYGRI